MSWTSRLKKSVGAGGGAPAEPLDRKLPPVDPVDPASVSRDAIVAMLRDDLVLISDGKLSHAEVEPDGHIFDYGYVDSLSAVVFLVRIEERFGVQIEDMELIESCSDLTSIAGRVQQGD